MDFETAMKFLETAKSIGRAKGVEVSVAILDAAGHPVLVARGKKGAWHGPYMAQGKARLAAAFRKSTAQLMDQWEDRPLYPMSLVEIIPGGVTLNKGGYPIFENGECIGAIGIGGSSPDSDHEVARETVEALGAAKPGTGKTNDEEAGHPHRQGADADGSVQPGDPGRQHGLLLGSGLAATAKPARWATSAIRRGAASGICRIFLKRPAARSPMW